MKNQCNNNNNNNELFLMLMICSILFATIISTTYATQQQGQKFTEIIPTTIGPIRGLKYENKNVFLGIPFGESTAGENRWKNPIPKTKTPAKRSKKPPSSKVPSPAASQAHGSVACGGWRARGRIR